MVPVIKNTLDQTKLAELIGILLGDGSINVYESKKYSTFYRIKISFHSQEQEYIEYVTCLIKELLNESCKVEVRKNEQTTNLLIFKKHLIEYFLNLGMVKSPKWNRAIIPLEFMADEFSKHVLRGYFDTDGSVVIANNNGSIYPRLEMKISPSPMQQQFISVIESNGFNLKVYSIGKGKVRVQMNGVSQMKKWFEIIGSSNPKHRTRADIFVNSITTFF